MRLHRLTREQWVAAPIERVWPFFASPANLDALTPPDMRFRITSEPEAAMTAGQIITYRIRLAPGVTTGWVTEITHIEEGRMFVDEQRAGPYRFWHHRHGFEERGGGVVVSDEVHYALPLGPIGELVHALDVRRRLIRIFDYRAVALERHFAQRAVTGEPSPVPVG
ncbi:MAG: SRPBCC family protein [Deinococcales bacterium]|jgi:ligand-binding SRPBCC domain-containing protein